MGTTYNQPEVFAELHHVTTSTYPNLDRFNRVATSAWTRDLATDRDFYDVDITYDRNSNITLIEDNVHLDSSSNGLFDVEYSIDNLDRLSKATEGHWNGSSISSKTREQEWELDHMGNWEVAKLDLEGDGDYTGPNEYNDDRTHNRVNELTARDTDDNGTDNYTLTHDPAENLVDDGEALMYEYDVFYRLRKTRDQSDNLVGDYRYNGLGFMIGIHEDTDGDDDVDGSDVWFYPAYDEDWRMVAYFREDDTDPKEEFIPHQAGRDGLAGSSYINGVICRDKDANTAWTTESDGTLEERVYYCQNWRGDVAVLIDSGHNMLEWVKYSSYGIPFALPMGDADSDGDCDGTDVTTINGWISSGYDVRGDTDLDGDVDSTDESNANSNQQDLGWDMLTSTNVMNRRGYAGYEADEDVSGLYHVRHRAYSAHLGRWLQRDPVGYSDGYNLVGYGGTNPEMNVDSYGLLSLLPGGWDDDKLGWCRADIHPDYSCPVSLA